MGFSVCDADRVAHRLMDPGRPVYNAVIETFGEQILSESGAISRPALGKLVFDHPEQLRKLNQLVHPAVRKELEQWIKARRAENKPAAVLLPLLFESRMEDLGWDRIVCVSSPEPEVFRRLEQRGLSPRDAEKRVRSQMPPAEKEKRADIVIPNTGTLGELKLAVEHAAAAIMLER